MEELLIVFAILLVLLILISTFGGSATITNNVSPSVRKDGFTTDYAGEEEQYTDADAEETVPVEETYYNEDEYAPVEETYYAEESNPVEEETYYVEDVNTYYNPDQEVAQGTDTTNTTAEEYYGAYEQREDYRAGSAVFGGTSYQPKVPAKRR